MATGFNLKFLKNIFDEVFLWTYKNLDETQHTTLKLNPITLSFPKEFETTFLSHYGQSSKWKMTAALMVGAIFYSLFFFLDYLLVPEFFINFLVVRLAVTWTFVGSTIFYIVKGKNDRLKQTFVSLTAIIVAITIIYYLIPN